MNSCPLANLLLRNSSLTSCESVLTAHDVVESRYHSLFER